MSIIKIYIRLFLYLNLLFIVACNSTQELDTTLPNKVAPNNCRINGTLVKIEEITDTSGPCSVYPCTANVKLNNVIESGFGFNSPLIKGDTIKIKFEFTLSETSKEQFPTLEKSFPGLKVGDTFVGDVEKIELIQLENKTTNYEYKVYNYDKIDLRDKL
ncbi:MAG: hypothetical protein KKE09_18575 [Bacteroidetes bacterium]|nr:hypothetical protein [Bacteroidota bacterium]